MTFVEQPAEEAAAMRDKLQPRQDKLIAELGIAPEILELAKAALQ